MNVATVGPLPAAAVMRAEAMRVLALLRPTMATFAPSRLLKINPSNVVSGFGVVYELGVRRHCLFGQPAVIQVVAPINLGNLMRL